MRRTILALAAAVVLFPITSLACTNFGLDEPAIERVQYSWREAEKAMSRGHYAEAVEHVESTNRFLPAIKDPLIRKCVTNASKTRVAMAKAGLAYLSAHPGDYERAKLASEDGWRSVPIMHNCP